MISDWWELPNTIEVTVEDHPEESPVLGPDGKPLIYEKPKVGFDLSGKGTRT